MSAHKNKYFLFYDLNINQRMTKSVLFFSSLIYFEIIY